MILQRDNSWAKRPGSVQLGLICWGPLVCIAIQPTNPFSLWATASKVISPLSLSLMIAFAASIYSLFTRRAALSARLAIAGCVVLAVALGVGIFRDNELAVLLIDLVIAAEIVMFFALSRSADQAMVDLIIGCMGIIALYHMGINFQYAASATDRVAFLLGPALDPKTAPSYWQIITGSIPVCVYITARTMETRRWWQIGFCAMLLPMVTAYVVFSQTRTYIFALAAGLIAAAAPRRSKRSSGLLVAGLVIAVGTGAKFMIGEHIDAATYRLVSSMDSDNPTSFRALEPQLIWDEIQSVGGGVWTYLGLGFGSSYHVTYRRAVDSLPHIDWLWFFLKEGLLGLGFAATMVLWLGRQVYLRRRSDRNVPALAALVACACCSFSGLAWSVYGVLVYSVVAYASVARFAPRSGTAIACKEPQRRAGISQTLGFTSVLGPGAFGAGRFPEPVADRKCR